MEDVVGPAAQPAAGAARQEPGRPADQRAAGGPEVDLLIVPSHAPWAVAGGGVDIVSLAPLPPLGPVPLAPAQAVRLTRAPADRPGVHRGFGAARRAAGGDVVAFWPPGRWSDAPSPAEAADRAAHPDVLFGTFRRLLAARAGQDTAGWASVEITTVDLRVGPGASAPDGAADGDPLYTVVASSMRLAVDEQQARLRHRVARLTRTLAALRALIAQIRERPPAPPAAAPDAPLQAEDLSGFDWRATYRLPAMLFARRVAALWHSGESGLELLDEADDLLSAARAAVREALELGGTQDVDAAGALAAAVEACVDGGRLEAPGPAPMLASRLLSIAHQLPADILAEVLRQAMTQEGDGGRQVG